METEYIFPIFSEALNKSGINDYTKLIFEEPKNESHGDLSTNIVLRLTKDLKKPPQAIAEELISNLNYDNNYIKSVNFLSGFINVTFTEKFYS